MWQCHTTPRAVESGPDPGDLAGVDKHRVLGTALVFQRTAPWTDPYVAQRTGRRIPSADERRPIQDPERGEVQVDGVGDRGVVVELPDFDVADVGGLGHRVGIAEPAVLGGAEEGLDAAVGVVLLAEQRRVDRGEVP